MDKRGKGAVGIVSVVILLLLFLLVFWIFATTELAAAQTRILHWNYFSHVLMVIVGVGCVVVTRKSFQSYGFTVRKRDGSSQVKLLFLALIPVLLLAAIALARDSSLILTTVIFQFFFAGFGEEILFRGYIQSRLNEYFARPWRLMGADFGPGLLITSALFGVVHALNPFNPIAGKYGLDVLWGVVSTFIGFLFGFVREKTGNVLSPSLAHGLVNLGQVIPLLF